MTPFKTIWADFCIVYPIDSFQDHLTQFYHCVPNWLLSRPFDLIMFVYPMTPFKTTSPNFIIVYPIDSFQDHLTQLYHWLSNSLLSRPFDLNLSLCPLLTPFKTLYLILFYWTQLTPFKTIWHHFITDHPNDTFQDYMTWFLHCVPNWLLSRPFDLVLLLCTQLTPFKTIWPKLIIVNPIDSFQDHLT